MHVDTDRPGVVKAMLPIRIEHSLFNGSPTLRLVYEGIGPGGIRMPFERIVGPPLDDATSKDFYRDPLGVAVIKIMQMFWDLEKAVCKMERERDEAKQRAAEVAADLLEAKQKIHGLQSRVNDLQGKDGVNKNALRK